MCTSPSARVRSSELPCRFLKKKTVIAVIVASFLSAVVCFPVSEEEKRELAALVQNRERTMNNVIGFVDDF